MRAQGSATGGRVASGIMSQWWGAACVCPGWTSSVVQLTGKKMMPITVYSHGSGLCYLCICLSALFFSFFPWLQLSASHGRWNASAFQDAAALLRIHKATGETKAWFTHCAVRQGTRWLCRRKADVAVTSPRAVNPCFCGNSCGQYAAASPGPG